MLARAILLLTLSLAACTAEQAYNSAQGWQRNQCNGIPDKAEYDRCMADARTPYGDYKRQTESDKKP